MRIGCISSTPKNPFETEILPSIFTYSQKIFTYKIYMRLMSYSILIGIALLCWEEYYMLFNKGLKFSKYAPYHYLCVYNMCCRVAIVWKHSNPAVIAHFQSICWKLDSVDLTTQRNIRKDAHHVDNLFKVQLVASFLCCVIFHVDFARFREMSISIFYVSHYYPHLEIAAILSEVTLWMYGSLGMIQCPFMLFYYIIHTVYQVRMFNAYILQTRFAGNNFLVANKAFQKLQLKRLIYLIERQQELKRMTILYLNIFSNSAFFYTVVAMLTSLAVLFYIFYDDSEQYRIHMLLLISLYTTVMFVIMKYGQRYEDEFENVFLNLCAEPWYDWSSPNRKIYLTMLMKSRKSESVRMGKLADLNCVFGKNIFQGIFTVANMFHSLQK